MEPYEPFRVHWFGPSSWAPVSDDPRYEIEVPVGEMCLLCEEPIEVGQRGIRYAGLNWRALPDPDMVIDAEDEAAILRSAHQYAHAECNLRSVTGNVTHLKGLCTYVGECNELETGTYRQQALAVWAWMQERGSDVGG